MREHDVDLTNDPGDEDLEALLRSVTVADTHLDTPPPEVWAGIAARLEAEGDEVETTTAPAPVPPAGRPGADVVDLSAHRRRRAWTLGAAAAVVVAVVVAVSVALQSTGDDDPVQLAATALAYDADAFDPLGADAAASAELVRDDTGERWIQLTDTALPTLTEDADLELWLIEPAADGSVADLVSLGRLTDDSGAFMVPAGVDPDVFSVVDISVEPRDGDATHSGRSILRGTLTA